MGWTSGSNSNIVGWGGSGGKTGGNAHGWVDENQGSKTPGGAVGSAAATAVDIAAEAAKAEGEKLSTETFNTQGLTLDLRIFCCYG